MSLLSEIGSLVVAGTAAGVKAWRDRRKTPAERLSTRPRPIDAALVAMLRQRQRDQEL